MKIPQRDFNRQGTSYRSKKKSIAAFGREKSMSWRHHDAI
jgi:hypothetical protein